MLSGRTKEAREAVEWPIGTDRKEPTASFGSTKSNVRFEGGRELFVKT